MISALNANFEASQPGLVRNPQSMDVDDEEVVPEQQIRLYPDAPVINIMKDKIGAVLESYTLDMKKSIEEMIKPKKQESTAGKNSPSSGSGNRLDTKRSAGSSVFDPGEEKEVELKIADLLDESQTYYEKNMNAAANNMSLLALHSVEIAAQAERQRSEREQTAKVVKNMMEQANFMSQKSG